jgi:hypothetical protein
MDIELLEMNAEKAKEAYLEYRTSRETEDKEIARIYRAIAKKQPVFDVNEVMKKAGLDHNGYPRLAICRADAEFCYLNSRPTGETWFMMDNRSDARSTRRYIRIPPGFFPTDIMDNVSIRWEAKVRAIVPIIPPSLRPKAKLLNYHTLWEPTWAKAPTPPYDPFLCKRLGGPIFTVLAAWDLTEVERMVIGMRV